MVPSKLARGLLWLASALVLAQLAVLLYIRFSPGLLDSMAGAVNPHATAEQLEQWKAAAVISSVWVAVGAAAALLVAASAQWLRANWVRIAAIVVTALELLVTTRIPTAPLMILAIAASAVACVLLWFRRAG